MTPEELYRAEAERRGIATRRPRRLTLQELAAKAGISQQAMYYQRQTGALRAIAAPAPSSPNGFRWEVEQAEADRWLRQYRWNARGAHVVHWRHRNRKDHG